MTAFLEVTPTHKSSLLEHLICTEMLSLECYKRAMHSFFLLLYYSK